MDKYGTWAAYTGNEAIILALVLFAITGILIYVAIRIRKPIAIKSSTKLLFIL
jgi:preprotein translocase subunit SecF